MKALLIVAVALPLLALAQGPEEEMEPLFPQQHTAADLLRLCSSSVMTHSGRERIRYCAGFVSGVEESARLLSIAGGLAHPICPPGRVSSRDLASTYLRYAGGRDRDLGKPAAEVALQALQEAYPCPQKP